MIEFVNTMEIKASPNRVFNFLADPTHLPLWNFYIKSVKLISATGGCQGARYHQIRKRDEQIFTITAFDPNGLIEFTSDEDSVFWFRRSMKFTSTREGTHIKDTFQLKHSGLMMNLLLPVAKRRMRNAVYANLNKLKELLEKGFTKLQDGRTMKLTTDHTHQPK